MLLRLEDVTHDNIDHWVSSVELSAPQDVARFSILIKVKGSLELLQYEGIALKNMYSSPVLLPGSGYIMAHESSVPSNESVCLNVFRSHNMFLVLFDKGKAETITFALFYIFFYPYEGKLLLHSYDSFSTHHLQ